MRNLTIRREKRFAAFLLPMKVYVADPNGDTKIVDTPCRRIGKLKNGEEQTFEIGEEETVVFVIAGKTSKKYCNDFCRIPAGSEDVFLSGSNKFSRPGSPFHFDGVDDPLVLQNRKKNLFTGLAILFAAALVGVIVGFSVVYSRNVDVKTVNPKVFTVDEISITLTDEFTEQSPHEDDPEDLVLAIRSDYVIVYLAKYDYKDEYTFAGFRREAENTYKSDSAYTGKHENDGLIYYTFDYEVNDQPMNSYAFYYESTEAFWVVEIVTPPGNLPKMEPDIIDWAKSVTFGKV